MSSPTTVRGILDLPPELRDDIYQYLLIKPSATITMLSNHDCKSEVSAAQPAICYVNQQIRNETLQFYYRNNNFAAELAHGFDIETTESWLMAIGEQNISNLRQVSLSGWTMDKIDTAQRRLCGYIVRLSVNPKAGTYDVSAQQRTHMVDGPIPLPPNDSDEMKLRLEEGLVDLICCEMDGDALRRLVQGFQWLVERL